MIKYIGFSDEITRLLEQITMWDNLEEEQVMQILGKARIEYEVDEGSFGSRSLSCGVCGYNTGEGYWMAIDTSRIEAYKKLCDALLSAEERKPQITLPF